VTVPVLLVDDNAAKRTAILSILSTLDCDIVEAASGVEALRCLLERDFAVILLDIRMPDLDGFETAALIRLRNQSQMTPIIFITAYDRQEIVDADRYVEGAVDFIFAPIQPNELRSKVSVFASLFTNARLLAAQASEVRASDDRLRLITDAAPVGIFRTDVGNRYVYTNPRWSEITGVTADEALGEAWDSIVGAGQRDALSELGDTDGSELNYRFPMEPDGLTARVVHVTARAIPDGDGGNAGWVGTLADVTTEAGAEDALSEARDAARAASQLKSDFLANMSHEIRTPMNGVIGMTDLLLDTELDACQRDYAQTVRNSAESLLTIIDDILDFSKVEAGKLEIEDIAFAARTVVDDVVDLLAGSAQAKGLELVGIVAESVPRTVSGDPGRLRQVLTNLVGNAIKFTQSGEVVIRVTEEVIVGDAEAALRFEVTDTGDGIAPEKLDLIFQPFAQADTSTSRKYGGTGLGLAISSQLVTLMGGDCGLTSELGGGSTFWFTISLRDAVGDAQPSPRADAQLSGASALVVDDNAAQCELLSQHLTGWGMTVTTAGSGRAALAVLRAAAREGRPFALALVDRTMAGMDGQELRQTIVADPSLTTRVVLMTDRGHGRALDDPPTGDCRSVSKPVRAGELRETLAAAMSGSVAVALTGPFASRQAPPALRGRVLLAEDNLINQKVAVAMLSQAGYSVDTVLNGVGAVAACTARQYDVVLLDCQMPELNGFEAAVAIRELEGAERRTPIIAMTAGARQEDRQRCLSAGMDGYLAKPVSKVALLAMVGRSVRGFPAPDARGDILLHPEYVDDALATA
jgi:PAS domain S-box-containing protein